MPTDDEIDAIVKHVFDSPIAVVMTVREFDAVCGMLGHHIERMTALKAYQSTSDLEACQKFNRLFRDATVQAATRQSRDGH